MDEKMTNYFIANALALNKCGDSIKDLTEVVIRQAKVNKRQRAVNTILTALCIMCVSNVADLIKAVRKQNIKIQELEEKINGDEQKGE